MRKHRALFFSIVFLMFGFFAVHADPIIDHTCTNLKLIPQPWLQAAKDNLHIAYMHTSHGSQLTDGMTGLVGFINGGGLGITFPNNFFAWNNDGTGGALDLEDYYGQYGDVGYYPAWVNNTRTYLGDPNADGRGANNPDVNVIIWSWCGQVSDKYGAGTLYTEYLNPMAELESDYFGIRFVYMTGHLNHWDDARNKAGNQIIREFCAGNKRILYDFADIESWDPHGVYYEFTNDSCDYYASVNGALLGNWATEWQNTHTQGTDWYDCGSAHSQPLNANQKAYAAWWLWARLAGWDGNSGTMPYTISGTITYNGSGLAGVVLNDLPGSPTTNDSGYYTADVHSGWSGTVRPTLSGYSFTPAEQTYAAGLTTDQTGQDYTAQASNPNPNPNPTESGGGGCFIASVGCGSSALKAFGLQLSIFILMGMFIAGVSLNKKEYFRFKTIFSATK
jgi:hypothetical protein